MDRYGRQGWRTTQRGTRDYRDRQRDSRSDDRFDRFDRNYDRSFDRDYDRGEFEREAQRWGMDPLDRQYGIRGGGNYGVYDIGGQGAQGYQRLSNNTYDDMNVRWDERDERTRSFDQRDQHEHGFFERLGESVGKFFGKGPKGYSRSDDRVKEDVCEALYRHNDIDASDIEVQVSEGVVTLSGTVDSRRTKRLAEDAVERVSGVKDVSNQLRSKQFSGLTETTSSLGYPLPEKSTKSDRAEKSRH